MKQNQQRFFMLRTFYSFEKIPVRLKVFKATILSLLFLLICTFSSFSQVTNINTSEVFVTIQSAIDAPLTLDGHTLIISAGTYNEAVTLSKSLTIEGATSDRTLYVLNGTGLPGTNSGIRINNGITGSTIQNLTIQNFTGGGANTHGGIFGVGGNNNTTVNNVAISNNINAAGFYANGPVNNVSVTNSLAQNHGPGARGIVLWNGLKSNITITGNTVTNNNCCGIEFQDGDASGVNVSNNIIDIGGGDNGIGIVGLNSSAGANLINNNTITGGGRYGIEIKNPAGGVTVSNNMVSLTTINADLRDRAGIAVFRRGVLGGNVDVPNGVTVTGNTVTGYLQGSASEGFGIVIEGTNHVVTGNTVSNCDVGILEQQNPSGYPGDADQSNLADLFFGRGNSPFTCGNEISGNNFSGNGLDTRELGASEGIVTNTNTNEMFCRIQLAINSPLTLDGHTLELSAGTYNEAVTLSKSLTIEGATSDRTLYIIDGTGLSGTNSGIRINNGIVGSTIQNLTIQNFTGGGANTHGGIFGVGGNNNTTINNVAISNNINAAGFYANGPVNNVSVTNSLAQNHGPGARGIVLWNGLKSNITITGNTVTNNNCCGIEFQDGDASGVNVSNNIIDIGGGDNGIGIVGLNSSVGTNLIDNNTITGGGRYGIEIKNPAGGVTVSNNMVSLTTINADLRDRAGIAVFRRGVLGGNVDVPNGVTVTGNTVTGYLQGSASEGFGIVIEGTNHVVTGNTVSNCDVGILEQQNPSGYPGDADQSNLADLFFGRGNSPFTCGNEISGNNFSGNGLDTRELGASEGIVTNTNTFESFCSIQAAINDPQTLATHVLEVSSATYDEQVLVTKGVTIRGVGATQPIVDFTGTVTGKPTLFDVSVDGVTIENINFNVDLAKLSSAIIASAVTLDNISILDNVIDAYGTPVLPYGNRNAVSVNYGGPTNYRVASGGVNNITFTGNTVNGTLPLSFFRSGISTDESGGTYSDNILQTINHDIIVRFANNGAVNITNNDFNGGGVDLSDQNAGAGTLTVSGNTFTGAGAPGAAVLRIKNNYNTIPHVVSGNTFTDFEWAVSLENMNNITLDGNTFSSSSTSARAVVKNTKSISSNSSLIVQVPVYATLTNNDFSGNGTALTFQNHDSDNDSYGTFNIGTVGNPNTFAATLTNFIILDDQTGSTNGSTFPIYPGTAQWETIMDCWATNLSIEHNTYDVGFGQQSPLIMDAAERAALESKLYHKPDAACLGELYYYFPVHNITQNTFHITIQDAINAVTTVANDIIEVPSGTYNEQVLVTKGVTIRGVGATRPIIEFTGIVTGKPTLFDVSVDGVTIENINFNVDLANLRSAIIASAVSLDNITVIDNVIDAYGTPGGSYGDRNAVSVNYTGTVNYRVAAGGVDNITFTGNTVNGTLPTSFFRSGISTDESGGTFSNNTLQTINHDVLLRFDSNGAVNISNNNFNGGGVELADQNAAAGTFTVSGNTFTGAGAPGAAVLRIKNNYNTIPHVVSGNTFTDFEWAVSLENMNNITLDGNTFSSSSSTARAIVKNTKSISSNSSIILQVPVSATLTNNDFSGNGTALTFQNHDSDNDSYGTFNIGTVGNPNTFAATLTNFIILDDQTGSTNGSTFPIYPGTAQWETIMDCWTTNLAIQHNTYDVGSGPQSPLIMDVGERAALENKLYHNPDAACLGELYYFFPIHNVTQNTFHLTIQDAIDAVTTVDNDVIEVPAGTYNEVLFVDKSLTINGTNSGINANEPLDITLINGARVAESVLSATIIQIAAQNVTIDGFKFIGAGGVRTDGLPANDADGLTIINNIFEDIPSPAYNNTAGAAAQSNIIFSLNRVDGNNTGAISAINAWEFINNMTINQNYFAEFERGIQLDNATSIDISNNYFTDITHQALQIANGCSIINVNQNVFDNCNIPAQTDRGAIRLYENVTGLISILNNEFTNNGNAVRVRAGGSFSHNHFVVQNNSFTSNTFGISDGSIGSTEPVNGQANWWGDVTGPSGAGSGTGDAVSLNVDFCPWLDGPLPTGMPINGGGLGEVKNTTTNVLYCSIQAALDASLVGEEIHFNSGSSTETISIDTGKKLVINLDATLTNNTTLTNNGTLEKIGAFNNNGVYTGFGTFIGNFVNSGTNRVGN